MKRLWSALISPVTLFRRVGCAGKIGLSLAYLIVAIVLCVFSAAILPQTEKQASLSSTPTVTAWSVGQILPSSSPTTKPIPSPTWTLQPTLTPYPTYTPYPTHTVVPTPVPSVTPAPTNTPLPMASPTSLLSKDAQSYILEAQALAQSYSDSFMDVATLTTAASENPLLMFDEEWRFSIGTSLAIWITTGLKVRGLEPPTGWREAHAHFVEASLHYDRAATLFSEGIDNLDSDKITAAITEMTLGGQAVDRSGEEFRKLAK